MSEETTAKNAQPEGNPEEVMAQMSAYTLSISFIMMLAQKAWVGLGKIAADPKTNEIKQDLAQAQYSIDVIAAIYDKLKPHISEHESSEIQNMLTNLRLNFVSAQK